MSELKKRLRAEMTALRGQMEKSVRKEYDERIYNNLKELDCVKNCSTFLIYASSPAEVDTRRFMADMLRQGKIVGVPKCVGKDMRFLAVTGLSGLVKSKFGVDEPSDGDEITNLAGSVCIVPALRFDRNGYRLGWGGGFYDRFLAGYNGISVGICYEICCGKVPTDEYDIPTDIVVTENGLFKS